MRLWLCSCKLPLQYGVWKERLDYLLHPSIWTASSGWTSVTLGRVALTGHQMLAGTWPTGFVNQRAHSLLDFDAGSTMSAKENAQLLDQVLAETRKGISLRIDMLVVAGRCRSKRRCIEATSRLVNSPRHCHSLFIWRSCPRSSSSSGPIFPRLQLREPSDGRGDLGRCRTWSVS